MDERLDKLLGKIYEIKDDMDAMIHLIKKLELLFEYEEDLEKRYLMKAVWLISEGVQQKVMTAAESIFETTK